MNFSFGKKFYFVFTSSLTESGFLQIQVNVATAVPDLEDLDLPMCS